MAESTVISTEDLILDNEIKLIPAAGRVPEYYAADNGIAKTTFHQTGNKVVYEYQGHTFTWKPQEMKYVDAFGMEDVIYMVQDVPLETKANYARYNRSMPDIDDWFIQENDRLKHQILVQGFQRDPVPFLTGPIDFAVGGQIEYDAILQVFADGIEQTGAFETAGHIEFRNDKGEVVFNLPEVVAYDSKIPDRANTRGKYRVFNSGNGLLAFQFVIDNAWISDMARVYPIVIDPTVVVASAYDVSGNGGRKIVRLSNGWIVAATFQTATAIILYVSKDNGATFTLLATSGYTDVAGFAIASSGTTVHLVFTRTNALSVLGFKFDALAINGAELTGPVNFDNQTALGAISLVIDGTGALHAAWASKNSTYPNSFNIRYSKSTNGGATWAAPAQITNLNTAGQDYTNPCIVLRSNNNPTIVFQQIISTSNAILSITWSGTAWGSIIYVYSGGSYAQANPCAAVDSLDNIHVVWHGQDATQAVNHIRYSKSTDGGATWSAMQKLTSGTISRQIASITIDGNNKLYVFFHARDAGNTYWLIGRLIYDGAAWSTMVNVTNASPDALNAQTLWSKFNMNSADAVRFMYMQGSAVDYDSITLNAAPTQPTNLLPASGSIDRATVQRLSWQKNDPDPGDTQSKFDLQWRLQGAGAWNTVTQSTPNQYWDAAANTFPAGAIEWQTRTYDQAGVVSPYSAIAVFNAANKPAAPTITAPANNATVAEANPTVQWSAVGQTDYELKVLDAAGATTLATYTATSTNNSKTVTYNLANGTTYKLQLRVKDSGGLWSDPVTVTINVSYTPPQKPIVTTTADNVIGTVTLTINNPTPVGSEPTNSNNEVWRDGVRIATGVAVNGSYVDYTVKPGVVHSYMVRVWGGNGTYRDSDAVTGSATLENTQLAITTDYTQRATLVKGTKLKEKRKVSSQDMQFSGREYPVTEFEPQKTVDYDYTYMVFTVAELETVRKLADSQTTLLLRDAKNNRKEFVTIDGVDIDEQPNNWVISFKPTKVDYNEGV